MKKLIFVLIFIFIIGGVLYPKISQKSQILESPTQVKKITVYQKVGEFENKKTIINKGSVALDLLKTDFKIVAEGDGKNAFVTKINDLSADKSSREFWAFYINGKQSQVGAGSYILNEGDKIEWKIETY